MTFLTLSNRLDIGSLDHFTLIVEDAKLTKNFYIKMLGFELIAEMPLNTGTVKEGRYDMLNYILKLPGKEEQTCVITQGLNEKTMFNRYLQKYGPGIHHVAYRTTDIEKVFSECIAKNIQLTSSGIIDDPIFELKQFFIDRIYSSVFIEIIERRKSISEVKFTYQNMAKLAGTMEKFV